MKVVFLGEIIKKKRKALNLTQAQLCEGICEPTTMSRIESGIQRPDLNIIQPILDRLGLPDECYYALVGKKEENIEDLKNKIIAELVRHNSCVDPEKTNLLMLIDHDVNLLLTSSSKKDNTTMQFGKFVQNILTYNRKEVDVNKTINQLSDILRMTIPNFDSSNINKYFFTHQEIVIIDWLALLYSSSGDYKKSFQIFSDLFSYLQSKTEKSNRLFSLIPLVALNYSQELCKTQKYVASIPVIIYGLKICRSQGLSHYMGDLIHNAGEAYYHLGNIEQSYDYYLQAYQIYKAMDHQFGLATIKKDFHSKFNKNIDSIFLLT